MTGISRSDLMMTRAGARTLRGMRPFDIGLAVAAAVVLVAVVLAAWFLTRA
ncbi:MAG TPA: hypothetical protein VJ400_05285 [Thermoplasmata archaeon]|nr:hypothetical protein [Thermoplasmata archaeon]